jgi:hypothetical protein
LIRDSFDMDNLLAIVEQADKVVKKIRSIHLY